MRFVDIKKKSINGDWNSLGVKVKTYVPLKEKIGVTLQAPNNVIKVIDGYSMIDRVESELNLYFLLLTLYTDIDFEDKDFTDEDYDFFASNRFKEWLRKASNQDSYNFEKMFQSYLIDSIRKSNSQSFNIDEINKLLSDPQIRKLIEWTGKENSKELAREMIEHESNNDSGIISSTT
jgi:hypothetical protein